MGLRQGSVIGEEPLGCAILAHNSLLAVSVNLESLSGKAPRFRMSARFNLLNAQVFLAPYPRAPAFPQALERPPVQQDRQEHQGHDKAVYQAQYD